MNTHIASKSILITKTPHYGTIQHYICFKMFFVYVYVNIVCFNFSTKMLMLCFPINQ